MEGKNELSGFARLRLRSYEKRTDKNDRGLIRCAGDDSRMRYGTDGAIVSGDL